MHFILKLKPVTFQPVLSVTAVGLEQPMSSGTAIRLENDICSLLIVEGSRVTVAYKLPALENCHLPWDTLQTLLLFAHTPAPFRVSAALAVVPFMSVVSGGLPLSPWNLLLIKPVSFTLNVQTHIYCHCPCTDIPCGPDSSLLGEFFLLIEPASSWFLQKLYCASNKAFFKS